MTQVGRHLLASFPRNVVQAVTQHVHDAKLHHSFRRDGFDSLREALESINADNEDVLHATVAQLDHHLQPELDPFGLGQPQTQHLHVAQHRDADGQIHRFDPHRPFAHLHVDAVQIGDGVDRIKRARLPCLDLFADGVGD